MIVSFVIFRVAGFVVIVAIVIGMRRFRRWGGRVFPASADHKG
ncbi:MAG: hypothetical protein WBG92_25300 [Thiohalocapsa sp.]